MKMEQFFNIMDSLLIWFVNTVALNMVDKTNVFHRKKIFFKSISEGSVNADVLLSMNSAKDANSVASGITKALNTGTSFEGYSISGSAEAVVASVKTI
jgi:hypothetical protein